MLDASKTYIKCDDLDSLPELNRKNYLFETELLSKQFPRNASVLQIGSMDGRRLFRLQGLRPDLKLTGLEIENELVKIATTEAAEHTSDIRFI